MESNAASPWARRCTRRATRRSPWANGILRATRWIAVSITTSVISVAPVITSKATLRTQLPTPNHRAIIAGDLKLVSDWGRPWGLFNLTVDRTELHDLIKTQPEDSARLEKLWNDWAAKSKRRFTLPVVNPSIVIWGMPAKSASAAAPLTPIKMVSRESEEKSSRSDPENLRERHGQGIRAWFIRRHAGRGRRATHSHLQRHRTRQASIACPTCQRC